MANKLTTRQKINFFLKIPVLTFLSIYMTTSLLRFLFKGDELFSLDFEVIITALTLAIVHTIIAWVDLISPPKSNEDSQKSIKEYIKQYVTEGSRFHRLMILIYILCIISVILVLSLVI